MVTKRQQELIAIAAELEQQLAGNEYSIKTRARLSRYLRLCERLRDKHPLTTTQALSVARHVVRRQLATHRPLAST